MKSDALIHNNESVSTFEDVLFMNTLTVDEQLCCSCIFVLPYTQSALFLQVVSKDGTVDVSGHGMRSESPASPKPRGDVFDSTNLSALPVCMEFYFFHVTFIYVRNMKSMRSFCLRSSRQQQTRLYSTCFSIKMLLAKLAQKGNFCLTKSDAVWSMVQMTTGSASLANDGDDSVSSTTFYNYTACTQYLW